MFEKLKYFSTIFFGTFIIAVGVYFFMNPNHIISGSISGLAVVLVNFVPLSLSAMTLLLNIICIILAFLFVDKTFGTKIIFISVLLPALLFVFEILFPNPGSPTGNIALDVVGMIVVICYGQAVLFNANAASGGLDIIAKIMNKYLHMDLGKSIIIAGMVTVASSYFAYDLQTVIIGALSTYFSGLVLDYFIDEFTGKIRVCVNRRLQRHAEGRDPCDPHQKGIWSVYGLCPGKGPQRLRNDLQREARGGKLEYAEETDVLLRPCASRTCYRHSLQNTHNSYRSCRQQFLPNLCSKKADAVSNQRISLFFISYYSSIH